jgi:hypothetical protein
MLSIHLRLGLPSGFFPSGFANNNLYTILFYPIRATCPARLILLKRRFLEEPQGVASQKSALFIVTVVETSKLTLFIYGGEVAILRQRPLLSPEVPGTYFS